MCPCYGEKHFPLTLEVSGPQASSEMAILPPGAGSSLQVGPADGRAVVLFSSLGPSPLSAPVAGRLFLSEKRGVLGGCQGVEGPLQILGGEETGDGQAQKGGGQSRDW